MGNVQRRPDGKYRARYRDPSGRERARHFARKIDAQRFLATVESDKLRGQYVDPDDRTTVAEYARRWAASRPHRASTSRRVERIFRNYVDGTGLGARRLASVLPSDAQAWAAGLSRRLAPTTTRAVVDVMRAVYRAAVADRLVASSPFERVTLPRTERERVVPLAVPQVRALADEVPERHRALIVAQAGLGLRMGELLALRAVDVDFLGRTVRVAYQLDEKTRERVEPKTPRSRRTMPLPTVVAETLAEHMRRWPPLPDGSLFYGHNRRVVSHYYYGEFFRDAARRLAARGVLPEGVSTHDLRHHYASVLLAAGESVVAVAERLGHENASLVLTTYGHLMPDSEDRTRKAVDGAWQSANADQTRTEVTP